MAYYDRIAKNWHAVTGPKGGEFRRLVLNNRLLGMVESVSGSAILEVGAGNGYFIPLLLRRFSGQNPSRIVITDISPSLINIAKSQCPVAGAEYALLDVRCSFPFSDESFDLVLATMLFNELTTGAAWRALLECHRILSPRGLFLATVVHPDLIRNFRKRGVLTSYGKGMSTMPSTDGLRVPVVERTKHGYLSMLEKAGFHVNHEDVFPTPEVLSAKPGLKKAGNMPLALIFRCTRVRHRVV
jgi:ubiquinone/menaquinone biosynthesis C-methylase UbiE